MSKLFHMADMPIRRRNRPNRYSDELLLDAAARVFVARGFHDASMLDIAQQAGATKPTLYARFGSKEAVYDRALQRIADSLVLHMAKAYARAQAATPESAVHGCCEAFVSWVRSNRVGYQLLFAPDQSAPTGTDHRRRALAALTELLSDAMSEFLTGHGSRRSPATELAAAFAWGALDHGVRWAVENDALDRLDVAGFSAEFTLNGLRGLSPSVVSSLLRRRAS